MYLKHKAIVSPTFSIKGEAPTTDENENTNVTTLFRPPFKHLYDVA